MTLTMVLTITLDTAAAMTEVTAKATVEAMTERRVQTMKLSEHIKISKRAVRLALYLKRTYTYCLILGECIHALTPYLSIYFSAKLVDALFAKAPADTLVFYALLTVILTFLLTLLHRWLLSVRDRTVQAIQRTEAFMYSLKSMQMAYESIEDRETSLLLGRIKKESQTGFNLYYLYYCIRNIVFYTAQIIASVSMTAAFFMLPGVSAALKLALLAGIALTISYGIFSTAKISSIDAQFYDSCVNMNIFSGKYKAYVSDYSAGKDIRLYDMADMLAENSALLEYQFYTRYLKQTIRQALISLPGTALNDLLKYATYLILILAAIQGSVSVGSIARYVSCFMMLLSAVSGLVFTLQRSFANHHYLKRYFSYFDIPNNMYQGSLTVEKRDDNEYNIEFRDVSFRYPNTEAYALRHINLKFRIGERLAVVGPNGSGKTTFIKLMCRLYDPTEGQILLNGVNIRKYDYDEYISIFSVVFQDFGLIAMTLGQNVATTKDYDREKARLSLIRAGFGERLASLPEGLDTYLYKNYSRAGVEISGGEAQKIALARALYRDAPFIILDEPTASLDPASEYEIYSKFNEIAGDKTSIYISHRLASCRFCDTIAVFDHGHLIQRGSHDELTADKKGKYYELWEAQAQYYSF